VVHCDHASIWHRYGHMKPQYWMHRRRHGKKEGRKERERGR